MKWKPVVLVMLITCALGIEPLRVAAQVADGDAETERIGSVKFWDYAMCGASIVFAAGTGGWVLAIIACGRAITEHSTT
jgi:hypothetical protein